MDTIKTNTNGYMPKKVLSLLSLVMINIIAVDSIRTLPMAANYGFALVTLYILGAIGFLIPTALITAELATTWPQKGGMYSWTKLAFGEKWGFCVVYLQWIYNIIWYPTILTLIASTIAYLYQPSLIQNATFMTITVLSTFWICTLLNCFGMRFSSIVSSIGTVFGTMFPMFLLIILAGMWWYKGNNPEIEISLKALNPNIKSLTELVFFSQIVYSLLGLEMSSVHALEVKNPKRDYPLALLISVVIIIFSLIFSSLAIAMVVPEKSLDNLTGLIQSFTLLSKSFNIPWVGTMVAGAILVGGIAAVATWIIGPTKGLFAAADDGLLPSKLSQTNQFGVPINMLILQALICSILTLFYLLLPSVEGTYFALSQMAAQLSMLMYIILFATAIRLRYSQTTTPRPFKIPGGNWGMWLTCSLGIITCLLVIVIGFIPPIDKIEIGDGRLYQWVIIIGLILFLSPVLFIHKPKKRKRNTQ